MDDEIAFVDQLYFDSERFTRVQSSAASRIMEAASAGIKGTQIELCSSAALLEDLSCPLYLPRGNPFAMPSMSLAESFESARDMDTHARFLLEEEMTKLKSAPTPAPQLPTTNVNRNTKQGSKPVSVSIPVDDDESPPLQRSDSQSSDTRKKDKQTKEGGKFAQATSIFVEEGGVLQRRKDNGSKASSTTATKGDLPEALSGCDKELVAKIESEIIHHGPTVGFDDIAGLVAAKQSVIESVCWPISNPHLFQGLRSIPRGILLFGPPGTGKTLIGKAIAHQSGATFFSISASSLMSKWIGEGEKTVRTLFAVANFKQPAVVFIDEIDSLLCQRSSDENEASRRMKTEFLVQLDGAGTDLGARVVIVGATNRPEELDEAVRRRFVKRLYIPLPDNESRQQLVENLLKKVEHRLGESDVQRLVQQTDGYSGADLHSLCTEAAMGPLRALARQHQGVLERVSTAEVPPVEVEHFDAALRTVPPSVSPRDLQRYVDWNNLFGSYRIVP